MNRFQRLWCRWFHYKCWDGPTLNGIFCHRCQTFVFRMTGPVRPTQPIPPPPPMKESNDGKA